MELPGLFCTSGRRISLLRYHQALKVSRVDHALVNLHFRESIVDLAGRELDTKGHEGVPEGLGLDLALVFEGLEGRKDDVIIVGATGHLGGEQGDHLGEVHGPVDLIKHGLQCRDEDNDHDKDRS